MYYSYDIVMTGSAAVYGTQIIANRYYDTLAHKLPLSLINRVIEHNCDLAVSKVRDIAAPYAELIYGIAEGGVFKGLWNLAEEYNTGITVMLDRISIKQEIIEICEVYDINPYMLDSTGSLLMISRQGNQLVRVLSESGIEADVIGYTTDSNDRIIINDGESRYLNSRIKDELLKLE